MNVKRVAEVPKLKNHLNLFYVNLKTFNVIFVFFSLINASHFTVGKKNITSLNTIRVAANKKKRALALNQIKTYLRKDSVSASISSNGSASSKSLFGLSPKNPSIPSREKHLYRLLLGTQTALIGKGESPGNIPYSPYLFPPSL